jgi:hypothetical protein
VQLLIGWFIMRALEELSQREMRVSGDLRRRGKEARPAGDGNPAALREPEHGSQPA